MHKHFADWYRYVSLEPSHEQLSRRWAGIEEIAASATGSEIPNIALAFLRAPAEESSRDLMRQRFQKHDATFPMRDNDLELAVLAGASLVQVLDTRPGAIGNLAALCLACCDLRGLHRTACLPEIIDYSSDYLSDQSRRLRRRDSGRSVKVIANEPQLTQILTVCEAPPPTNAGAAISDALRQLTSTLNELITHTSGLEEDRAQFQEESDVLWWLMGECSREVYKPFVDLAWPAAAVQLGKELADIVRVLPGPFSAQAFLYKALSVAGPKKVLKPVRLSEAIEGLDQCTVERWRFNKSMEAFCPVSLSVHMRRESGDSQGWQDAFKNKTGVAANVQLQPIDLAYQTYSELILDKTMASF